ncbi:kinase-like domain-containing protein [Catenaria anguillulae PL171]|uniref:non-specific serine/threonine protein kinase n=1 Tax=Catenaria anguillulae PL171 TaxID=765915 RepID=A0A1Y2HJP8_9FUNG|nr:kinase-like domain-containing protein [Catenaria anguillulae PL171]
MSQLIKQGAEARIYTHLTLNTLPSVSKQRFSKSYRHPDLDAKLTLARLLQEARALHKARHSCRVRTPRVYFVDKANMTLTMEAVDAPTMKDWVLANERQASSATTTSDEIEQVCDLFGRAVARLHAQNLIHGDLTTSNVLVQHQAHAAVAPVMIPEPAAHARRLSATPFLLADQQDASRPSKPNDRQLDIVMIDFGLASTSTLNEDKAVDLYVLERAIRSTHPKLETLMLDAILGGYMREMDEEAGKAVMAKLEEVRLRGRKRSMIG